MTSRLSTIFSVSAFLFIILGMARFSNSQERRHDEPISDELYSIVVEKINDIQIDNVKTGDDFAGSYEAGDHHPPVFRWSRDKGFVVTASLHTFYPSWVNYGSVEVFDQFIKLTPTLTGENKSAHLIESELWKIRWDEQRFLVPRTDLLLFAYAAHSRSDWQIYGFFTKIDTISKRRRGLPTMPSEYGKILNMAPIVTTISALGKGKGHSDPITIAAGKNRGIVKGMTFYHLRTPSYHLSFTVTDVSETSSQAIVSSSGISGSGDEPGLRVGGKLTSRMPRNFIAPG